MNRLVIIVIAVLAALYVLISSIFVLNERDQAIVMRFGEITRVHQEPGVYFKVPTDIVETVQIIEDRILRYDLEDIRLQVSGGKFYVVDAFVTYRIADPVLFRQSVLGSVQLAEQRLDTRLESALRQVYGLRDFEAALSEQRTAMMRETRDLLRRDMDELGIEIVDVRVLRTDLTQEVSQQTFDRMSAERQAEAALLRARGQELAQTLRAQADRQAVEIVASANRDSSILRGEGDAERNAIYAEAYNLDQEFFDFYRTLIAYEESISGETTSMVLSPNSEFFQYFGRDVLAGEELSPATPAEDVPEPQEVEGETPEVSLETNTLVSDPDAGSADPTEPAAPDTEGGEGSGDAGDAGDAAPAQDGADSSAPPAEPGAAEDPEGRLDTLLEQEDVPSASDQQ